jgi:hypothetical protein
MIVNFKKKGVKKDVNKHFNVNLVDDIYILVGFLYHDKLCFQKIVSQNMFG